MASAFEARHPEFERVVRESFARQPMMASLGARLTRVEAGRVHVALARAKRLTQQNGFLHAGALAAIADSARGDEVPADSRTHPDRAVGVVRRETGSCVGA